ncbi:MAG: ribokinase [Anaerolineaceae bacterium]|nr:ribokinase [Anaerolineaceae bacterium]
MSNPVDIVVVGSHAPGIFVRVKRIPKAGETVIGWDFHEPKDGGKGSNQAIAAALLGGKTSFVGCFGQDRIGDEGEFWLKEVGVDTTWLKRLKSINSGVGFILLDENNIPAMVTSMGANAELNKKDVEKALEALSDAKVMLTQFEIPVDVALHAAKVAKQMGMISIVNPGPAPENPVEGLDSATILIPNETEAQVLLGQEPGLEYDARELAQELKKTTGVPVVIITLGADGIVGFDNEGFWKETALKVDVVDTSGAGDVFCSALAVGIVNGKSVRDASKWACKVASLSVTKPGTIPSYPTITEVKAFHR